MNTFYPLKFFQKIIELLERIEPLVVVEYLLALI